MDGRAQPEIREQDTFVRERRGICVRATPNAAGAAPNGRRAAVVIGWATIPGIILGFLGPFGSFAAPLPLRLAYWVPTMAAGAALGMAGTSLLRRAPALERKPVLFALALSALVTAGMVFVVWGWAEVVFGGGAIGLSWITVFYVGFLTLVISGLRLFFELRTEPAAPPPAASSVGPRAGPQQGPLLARRLKPELRASPIFALEAEDHYVRVHTAAGSDLILLRLSDAIDEMAGAEGLRTHRSWWVSKDAITRATRDNGKLTLTLSNGLVAPVSRAAAGDIARALSEKV